MEKRERNKRRNRNRDPPSRNDNRDAPPANTKSNSSKEENKKVIEEKTEKKVIDHTAIPDPHMFDNLKRETEEIAALKRRPVGTKRQIFSNWSRYETPPEAPGEDGNGSQKIGEDFESLLQQGAQAGSHFRFKSERSWDPDSAAARTAVLTLDLGQLAEALACVPFYERLNLPTDIFTAEELERMDRLAKQETTVYNANLPKRTAQAKEVERQVKVDLAAESDVQLLQVDAGQPREPREAATFQWDLPQEDVPEEVPVVQPLVILPELPTDASSVVPQEAVVPSSVVTPQEHPAQPPVETKSFSPVPETVVQVDEQPAPPRDEKSGTRRQKGRGSKGKQGGKRKSWTDEDDLAVPEPQINAAPQPTTVEEPAAEKQSESRSANVPGATPKPAAHAPTPPRTAPAKPVTGADTNRSSPAPETGGMAALPAEAPRATPPRKPAAPKPPLDGSRGDDDQLDFLLSLRKSTKENSITFSTPSSTAVRATIDEDDSPPTVTAKKPSDTKKEVLEDWLDSMLDD